MLLWPQPLHKRRRQALKGYRRQREGVTVALDRDRRFAGHGSIASRIKKSKDDVRLIERGIADGPAHSGETSSSWWTRGLSRSTLPVGQPGPDGLFSQPRMGRTMFSAAIGMPL